MGIFHGDLSSAAKAKAFASWGDSKLTHLWSTTDQRNLSKIITFLFKNYQDFWSLRRSIGNLVLIFFFVFPETSIFNILHLCFELSRITSIFGIPEIPKKCVRSKCFIEFCGSTIRSMCKWKQILYCSQVNLIHSTIGYNNVVRTLGNLPSKFPLQFYILDNLGLLTRPFCVPNDRHGWQGWTDMRNGTNLDKCGNRFNLVRSSSSGK